ncbi:SAM-dependent methyltransferase [Microtetraspora fusca]
MGSGMPSCENVHQIAQVIAPKARASMWTTAP